MRTIQELKTELSELLNQNKEILEKAAELRQEIAEKECPFNIGDDIAIEDLNGKIVNIKIDSIGYLQDLQDIVLNSPDSDSSWTVSGYRYNKTSGQLSHSHRASANPWDYNLNGNHFTAATFSSIRFGRGFISIP